MKYQVKKFHDSSAKSESYKSKEDAAAEWLNKMAKQGYRFAGITSYPLLHKKLGENTVSTTSLLIVVVEKPS